MFPHCSRPPCLLSGTDTSGVSVRSAEIVPVQGAEGNPPISIPGVASGGERPGNVRYSPICSSGRRSRSPERPAKPPCAKHSIGGWPDSAQSRPRAIWHPFFGTLKSAPNTRELGRSGRIGRIGVETGPSIERILKSSAGSLRSGEEQKYNYRCPLLGVEGSQQRLSTNDSPPSKIDDESTGLVRTSYPLAAVL